MRRYFHIAARQSGMVAWVHGKRNLLLTNEHFHELAKEELKSVIDEREIVLFTTYITLHLKSKDEKAHGALQAVLHRCLLERLANKKLDLQYNLGSKKAKRYIEDFLEGYKSNYGYIGYATGSFHDSSDEILNISMRKQPNMFQRLTGRLGDPCFRNQYST
jgi:hypothetical protein